MTCWYKHEIQPLKTKKKISLKNEEFETLNEELRQTNNELIVAKNGYQHKVGAKC